jgi:hypothetical protein
MKARDGAGILSIEGCLKEEYETGTAEMIRASKLREWGQENY